MMKMTQNGEIKEAIYSQIEKINIVKMEYSQSMTDSVQSPSKYR